MKELEKIDGMISKVSGVPKSDMTEARGFSLNYDKAFELVRMAINNERHLIDKKLKRALEDVIKCCDATCGCENDIRFMDIVLQDIRSKASQGLKTKS